MNAGSRCLREPIPEIFDAARFLDAAVSAHMLGQISTARELFRLADMPAIRDWSEALWGAGGPWTKPRSVENPLPFVPRDLRTKLRMPSSAELKRLLDRDGFHCRFCGIPLVQANVRAKLHRTYPNEARWGDRNAEQHAGLQAMWLQFDHLVPHARGGTNAYENMIVTCAPCNNGRSNLTIEEAGLSDPRDRKPVSSSWDGLERFR